MRPWHRIFGVFPQATRGRVKGHSQMKFNAFVRRRYVGVGGPMGPAGAKRGSGHRFGPSLAIFCAGIFSPMVASIPAMAQPTVARQWNEALLDTIRIDFPFPTIHARNLYHSSAAMWDAWGTFDGAAAFVS